MSIYENSGATTGANVIGKRTKIFETSGIHGNSYDYTITGARTGRNLSADITFVDFTGNSSSGMITSLNPIPTFDIINTGLAYGIFAMAYSGGSNGFNGVDLYNFTGASSGSSGVLSQERAFVSKAVRVGSGNNGYVAVELSPGENNYIMPLGRDQYNTGEMSGFFKQMPYITGSGFSGISGNAHAPLKIDYPITISAITGYRIVGGGGIIYSFEANYNTGSSLIETVYGITGTGITTEAVYGYNAPLFLDSGVMYDTDYNANNTGLLYVYDNSLSLERRFNTGELVTNQEITGEGFTGYLSFGSGAGSYWSKSCPKYSASGSGIGVSGGSYSYGYYDPNSKKFGCTSNLEVSGGSVAMNGIYSMPKDNPNSYKIKYRSGYNFSQGYEQASSYLNQMGEMPAVIINNSQLNKIKSLNYGPGWVGLRRGNVSLLSGLFSEDYKSQEFFASTNFASGTAREVEAINSSGFVEKNYLYVNDIGNYWAWTNSSGTAIYKYAGSGSHYARTSEISIDVNRKLSETSAYYISGDDGINGDGFYYPLYLSPDAAGFPCHVHYISGATFYMPLSDINHARPSLPAAHEYAPYITPYLTGAKIIGNAPAPIIKEVTLASSGIEFEFNYLFENQYYDRNIQDTSDLNYNNYNAVKASLYTGNHSGFLPSEDNLYTSVSIYTEVVGQSLTGQYFTFTGSITGGNPSFFKLLAYDYLSSGKLKSINQKLIPSVKTQTMDVSLDPQFYAQDNELSVEYPVAQASTPSISHTLSYIGTSQAIGYLGAMIKGAPSTTGADFLLTAAPPATGYELLLIIQSH